MARFAFNRRRFKSLIHGRGGFIPYYGQANKILPTKLGVGGQTQYMNEQPEAVTMGKPLGRSGTGQSPEYKRIQNNGKFRIERR